MNALVKDFSLKSELYKKIWLFAHNGYVFVEESDRYILSYMNKFLETQCKYDERMNKFIFWMNNLVID